MIDERTKHGLKVAHGLKTPHKLPYSVELPQDESVLMDLSALVGTLYPSGRAWYKPVNGVFDTLHDSINLSFLRVIQNYEKLINESLPDNEDFTKKNAEYLEYQYGLTTNDDVDLELRKAALRRKIGHPNNLKTRQDKNFIENQLNLSGFDVKVYENTPPYKTPAEIGGLVVDETQHGGNTQHASNTYHGGVTFEVIANKIEPSESYGIGDDLWASFFIGGSELGKTAEIPQSRQREFRELVLKLKPAHLAAYIFINFT